MKALNPFSIIIIVTIIIITIIENVNCYRILFFVPTTSKSHKVPLDQMINQMAVRGHQVTVVTAFPTPTTSNDNITGSIRTIQLPSVKKVIEKIFLDINNSAFSAIEDDSWLVTGVYNFAKWYRDMNIDICHVLFNNTEFKSFIENPGEYDVVISLAIMNECYIGISKIFNAPFILFYSSTLFHHTAWIMNIPTPTSYVPVNMIPFSQQMTFIERFKNMLVNLAYVIAFNQYIPYYFDPLVRQHVPGAGTIVESVRNTSLILVNSNLALDESRPTTPYMIDVGGMHCKPVQKLPQEFDNFIEGDAGDAGFIVFSLGSVIQGHHLPEHLLKAFVDAFSKIKQRVIWKFEKEIKSMPSNVMITKWMPQQDLIGHPKCRLAITHGGLLSLQEAAYHGTPLLGIPLGGDRDGNFIRAVQRGFALTVDWRTINGDILLETINELVENPKYTAKAKEVSSIMKDQPLTSMETTVYWLEYIARHRGAPHLKSAAVEKLNLFQYFHLDVFALIFFASVTLMVLVIWTASILIKILTGLTTGFNKNKKNKTKKN